MSNSYCMIDLNNVLTEMDGFEGTFGLYNKIRECVFKDL